ncbi:hypothetical protein LMG23992_04537 [Cupriavidus laharis]|uniref:DUF637 domain-containing protein n=1 Tax=Cupriavidus laharis TaxID=151654 RepID=A0ABM8XN03_9BURK|nr:DUF637 domain-containing protein [Cupriavidus laharis]CAG9181599.1 hypothetical protein LMG23992_04537 [Cupriavidus laharis]
MTVASLSNRGGVISAAHDVTLNVGTLDNGHSASLLDGVTDTVNQASLSAFLAQLQAIGGTTMDGLSAPGNTLMYGPLTIPVCNGGDNGCSIPVPVDTPLVIGKAVDGSAVTGPVQASVTERLGKAGQIIAGRNLALNGTGDLTNAGDLAALGNIRITTPGTFTNQGFYDAKVTSTPGCAAGSATCNGNDNPHVDTLAWQQNPNTVSAGQKLSIEAGNIQNRSGTLAALGDVSLKATSSVTNVGGAIQSLSGDVSINAPTLVNQAADPVALHKNYGNLNPSYASGCNAGGTYKESNCAANEMVAGGPAGVIQAARDVNLSGTTLTNHGALISGGHDVTVAMSGPVDNSSIALNASWVGRWVEKTGPFSSDKRHDTAGVAVLGSLESGIQAGNTLSVSSGGQILNTGNLMGGMVDVTGAALVNGYTSPKQPTPPSTAPRQVISLGPAPMPDGSLPPGTPATDPTQPWQFKPAIVVTPTAPTTGGASTLDWHFTADLGGNPLSVPTLNGDCARYVNPSAATSVLGGITPDRLLDQLPSELRPGNVSFYYDPYTEGQKLQQAALQQTGQASFINGLTYDSQHQLSVTDQEKLVLYKNAADYAKEHNLALGTALTPEQVLALDKPMLWYVEQAVPDPNCNTVSSAVCPGVLALVPQVYLPEGYAQALAKPTGGTITGENVKLDIAGLLSNSGTVLASDTLDVKAGSLDLSPNVVDIGTSAYRVSGGWMEYTGTQVQPGGFMGAMHMNVKADSIHAVNDALRVLRADGMVDEAATNALIAQLKDNLGAAYTEGTVSDDIHTHFIKEEKGLGAIGAVVAVVAAVALSIVVGPEILAALDAVIDPIAFAAISPGLMEFASAASYGLTAGATGFAANAASQLIATGQYDVKAGLKTAATATVAAGLIDGLVGSSGLNTYGAVTEGIPSATLADYGSTALKIGERGLISAGTNIAFNGGSFGQALITSVTTDLAAVGANWIGGSGLTSEGSLANVLAHAALGCASSAALGTGCAGGAVGGGDERDRGAVGGWCAGYSDGCRPCGPDEPGAGNRYSYAGGRWTCGGAGSERDSCSRCGAERGAEQLPKPQGSTGVREGQAGVRERRLVIVCCCQHLCRTGSKEQRYLG